MIEYVIVHGEPGAIDRVGPDLGATLDATRVVGGEVCTAVAPSRRWAAAWCQIDDRLSRTRVVVDGDDLLAVNGPALHPQEQQDLAPALLARYRTGGAAEIVDALGGTYNVTAVDGTRGLCAFPDFSSLYPVYWRRIPGATVVGNRASAVGSVGGPLQWDLHALAWVIGHANLFGGRMPARDVLYVLPGHELVAPPGGASAFLRRGATWAWPDPDADPDVDNLTDEEWDEVTASLVENIRALHAADPTIRLRLTGGKDSRLCLSLALAAGIGEDLHTITTGPWDSPEVEVAAALAKVAGVSHERIGPPRPELDAEPEPEPEGPPPEPVEITPEQAAASSAFTWSRLRQDVYRYDGAICAWSGLQNPVAPPAFDIKGFGGEFYRRGNSAQFRDGETLGLDELAERFTHYHQVHDPLHVLVPEVAEFQSSWLRTWVHETARDVRLDLLPDKFYVDHRLAHWSGPVIQHAPLRVNANPLLTQRATRANARLSVAARSSERFHYEVMRRAAPELVRVPFLRDTWKPRILADDPDLPTEPFAITIRPKRPRSWGNPGWSLLEHDSLAIEKLFHRAIGRTDMGEVCDMRRLKRRAHRSAELKKSAAIKELFSAIGVALALLGEGEPVRDG